MTPTPMRARIRCARSGAAPGGRTLSRTALPMMVRRPAVRNTPSAASTAPNHGDIGRSAVASATTGTMTMPAPAGPSTVTDI